jgi:hypothetical protein
MSQLPSIFRKQVVHRSQKSLLFPFFNVLLIRHTVYSRAAPYCIVNLLYLRHLILVNQLCALPITYLPTGSFGVQ